MARGTSRIVLDFVTANADINWTLESLATHTGLTKTQISQAAATLKYKFPSNFIRVGSGIYKWSSDTVSVETPKPARKEMIIKILKTNSDGIMFCQDMESEELYTLSPVEW